jgi:CBS domain-containing protein
MYVRDILKLKGSTVIAIKPTDTIRALCRTLREKRIGATIVSANGQTIDGVISERDVAYGLAVHGDKLDDMLVLSLMTKTVITCAPNDRIAFVASTMLSRNIRHIPVAVNGSAVGMVSIRDVLNSRVVDLQQESAQLRAAANQVDHGLQDRE